MKEQPEAGPHSGPERRRQLRRRQRQEEILDLALEIMAVDGVAGLTVTSIARRLDVKPPAVYKYFDSLLAIHDELFRRGQRENLQALQDGVARAPSGLPALREGMDATARWAVSNPVLAQLLFWRPVPGYEPSQEAFEPALEIIAVLKRELEHAADDGDIARAAATDEGMALLSTMHFGVISQHLANDPSSDWEHSRYTPFLPVLLQMFVTAYPPPAAAHPPRLDETTPGTSGASRTSSSRPQPSREGRSGQR